MKTFGIYGDIVDTAFEKANPEDVCVQDVKDFLKTVEEDEDIKITVNSCGGSVTGGIAIANALLQAQNDGHKVTAVIEGLAASIASVIVCACGDIVMPKSSFLMIHKCWGTVQGNSDVLRKEADVMDTMNKAIMSFYLTKFDKTEEELERLMQQETWFSGAEAEYFGFHCSVTEDVKQYKIAASVNKFNNLPIFVRKNLMEKNEVIEEVEKPVEEEKQEQTETEEVETEVKETETPEEKTPEEIIEELKKELEECKAKLAEYEANKDEDVEKRVSGMQSTMAKKMDALDKDYQNKILDFTNQLKVKDEELTSVKNEVISLHERLEDAKKELSDMTSAFEEKNTALAQLNASVLKPADELPTFHNGLAKCATLKERMDFINSGKFTN